jgi:ABC-type Fe3+/spermidine/putrescine transport system ATPase subunit
MRTGYRIISTLGCTFVFLSIATAHEITIAQRAKVGNDQELDQGTYRVEVEKNENSAEVLFFRGEDLVAAAHATLTKEEVKSTHTEVHSQQADGERVITKIWLQGWKESLVFKQDTPEGK